ncbi:DUF1501 domain-containing protein [Planctomyces sp. SH-PL14]|uniref:DUF1501 domain-containing protein n=1 Tax=Planctomyces sp. SH-PL14 TaxID=1632864 RepID=UPI00078E6624|nr:DUF1501 domain-containing protein [Planctomyces sp. SH-PL14]AMV21851.1 hypothetical protein VT03_28375 [Planctomyces sp. SH-PL14]
MITILSAQAGKTSSFCDRLSRRGFLTIGGMALGGLGLSDVLAAEPRSRSHKAIINIYLPGGPSHIDMWDPKPDAPREVRGEFNPISTNVPGIQICELFPQLAAVMDKVVVVRSLSDSAGLHDGYQCMTGRKKGERSPPGGWPSGGAWVSKMQGPAQESVPPNIALMYQTGNRPWGEPGTGGFLGVAHAPFNTLGREARSTSDNMVLQGVTLERLQDRVQLRRAIDSMKEAVDNRGIMDSLDVSVGQAMGILTSSRLADALDLSKEDPKIVARYGKSNTQFQRDGAPQMVENFCIARRLVEAGARFVSMNYSRWDWHGNDGMNFPKSREEFPMLDQALAALITDLHERGLDRDVSVVVWGEFGRTPKINSKNSRDHWPQANGCLMFGGGMRTGQVVGRTNRNGEFPEDRPVKFQEVFATLYRNAGIDVENIRIFDQAGVPQYLVEQGNAPMRELV